MWNLIGRTLLHRPLTEPALPPSEAGLAELAAKLATVAQTRLGRSLAIRQVDAGSCNGCELEIHALNNAFYDLERFGLRFVASPRHADVLLVTGPVTKNMREALERTYNATPDPKWVVAIGDCAADGRVERCHLRDPSWFQWPLLEAVIESNIVADFPLCNKSFNCSYSGHDL